MSTQPAHGTITWGKKPSVLATLLQPPLLAPTMFSANLLRVPCACHRIWVPATGHEESTSSRAGPALSCVLPWLSVRLGAGPGRLWLQAMCGVQADTQVAHTGGCIAHCMWQCPYVF